MFFALDAIVRKCVYDRSYAFFADNSYYTSFYKEKPHRRLKKIAPYFRSALNYNLGMILAPADCFPSVMEGEPYYLFSQSETFYKVCKVPNMLDYFKHVTKDIPIPSSAEFVAIGVSKQAIKRGSYSIAEALYDSTDHNQPNFAIGFI